MKNGVRHKDPAAIEAAGPSLHPAPSPRSAPDLEQPSRALLRFFDTYLRYFVKRHFHGLRLAGAEHWPASHGPLLICLNHPSWWDPLTSILLSRHLEKAADHYAPMDALAFARYGILRKLGLFPVEQGTPRGAAQFLRSAQHILADRNTVLWVTPQGGFTDVRARPVVFRAGLDALLRRTEKLTVIPLALEYTFWDERKPEALAMLGAPLYFNHGTVTNTHFSSAQSAGTQVAAALEHTQEALAALSAKRDPGLFTAVLSGVSGTSGVYGAWQRLRALTRGERFEAEHASLRTRAGSTDA